MSLKSIFNFDLRRLFPGYKPRKEAPPPWFVLLYRGIQRFRTGLPPQRAVSIDDPSYAPGGYYHGRGSQWAGPRYLSPKAWQDDLLGVVDQLTAIVRTNASLPKGLEAAAREEQRMYQQFNASRLYHVFGALGIMTAFVALSLRIFFELTDKFPVWACIVFCVVPLSLLGAYLGRRFLDRSKRREALLLTLRDSIANGRPLSESMQRLRRFFPRFYVDMVKAGEDSGKLAECLEQLGEETLGKIAIGQALRMNFIYLGAVICVQFAFVSNLLLKVAPIFSEVFEDFGGALPSGTRRLMALSDFVVYHWPLLFLYAAIMVLALFFMNRLLERSKPADFGMRRTRRRGVWTRGLSALFLLVPGVRGLVIKQNLSTVALILEKLITAGVPLERALESVANGDLNPVYARAVRRVRADVLQGASFTEAWDKQARRVPLPGSFRAFIGLGEQSGMLPQALARIADNYHRDVSKGTHILSEAVLPFCVLALGYCTLMILLGLYEPIFMLSDVMLDSM